MHQKIETIKKILHPKRRVTKRALPLSTIIKNIDPSYFYGDGGQVIKVMNDGCVHVNPKYNPSTKTEYFILGNLRVDRLSLEKVTSQLNQPFTELSV